MKPTNTSFSSSSDSENNDGKRINPPKRYKRNLYPDYTPYDVTKRTKRRWSRKLKHKGFLYI